MAGLDTEEAKNLYTAVIDGGAMQEFEFMCNWFYNEGMQEGFDDKL